MLSKSMQGKYNQVVRDGNKYYSQAKDVYYAEVAPKIGKYIVSVVGRMSTSKILSSMRPQLVLRRYIVLSMRSRRLSLLLVSRRCMPPILLLEGSLVGCHPLLFLMCPRVGPELTDRAVFIILSMALFRWAVRVLKALLLCVGFMFCSKRAKSVPSGESGSTEEAKAQHGKVSRLAAELVGQCLRWILHDVLSVNRVTSVVA